MTPRKTNQTPKTTGKQPNTETGLYTCEGCGDDKLLKEDMMQHSSGSVCKICKKCEAKRRRKGQLKSKAGAKKTTIVKKVETVKRGDLKPNSTTSMVLEIMKRRPDQMFSGPELLGMVKDPGGVVHLLHNIVDALKTLRKRGEITRVKRGKYRIRMKKKEEAKIAGEILPGTRGGPVKRGKKDAIIVKGGASAHCVRHKDSEKKGRFRGNMILTAMRKFGEEEISSKEIAKRTGDKSKNLTNTHSALAILVKSGEVKKTGRGMYSLNEDGGDDDINSSLNKANGVTSSLRKLGDGLVSHFKKMGKELTSLNLSVREGMYVVNYEVLEKGEVVL